MSWVLEHVRDYAIFMLDRDGRILTWNRGAAAIKGYATDEILGEHVSRFYPPEELATGRPRRLLTQAARTGRAEDEGWRVRKDGTRFWANVVISAIYDEAGELSGFLKVTRDLTDRRRADEALRQSEQRLRLMIGSVSDYAIFLLDPSGHVASWNPGAERIKGYRADEIIGQHFSRFYNDEQIRARLPEHELEVATATGRFEDEGWRVRKDGTRFWASVVISAVRDEHGVLVGFTKVTRDLTERRRAQQALEATARQQEAMAELGMHALRTLDLGAVMERVVTTTAAAVESDLIAIVERARVADRFEVRASRGWRPEIAPWIDVPAGAAATAPADVAAALIAAPQLREHGIAAGTVVPVPGPTADAPAGYLGVFTRGSAPLGPGHMAFLEAVANALATAIARTTAEEQVRDAEVRAAAEAAYRDRTEAELRERDEFISIAAHELRTPLTALQLRLEILADAAQRRTAGEINGNRLDSALRQTARLGHLIERLLDVTRIAAGSFVLDREECDLAEVVRDVVDELRDPAERAGCKVRVDVAAGTTGVWDRMRLAQLISNLLSNAIRYGPGAPIEIAATADDRAVRLSVIDRGRGIPAEDLERVFQRFQRAAPIREYGGLGLGLYISRHIVHAHGGTIHVTSAAGRGATFSVELPRRAPATVSIEPELP